MTQSFTHAPWQVGHNTARCSACGRGMTPGETCWAALLERPPMVGAEAEKPAPRAAPGQAPLDMQRLDFCPDCWAARQHPEAGQTLISFWKTAVPDAGKTRRPVVDDHVLVELFSTLEQREAPPDVQLRFVLALLLMRKKLLKYDGVARPKIAGTAAASAQDAALVIQSEVWRMLSKDGASVLVANPELTPEQISDVSQQLSAVLAAQAE